MKRSGVIISVAVLLPVGFAVAARNVAPGSTVYTDCLKSFTRLPPAGFQHVPRIQRIDLRKGAKSVVLQVYLDEFVFRHNRRRLPMAAFQTLLGLGTSRKPTHYKPIRGAADLFNPNLLGPAEPTG